MRKLHSTDLILVDLHYCRFPALSLEFATLFLLASHFALHCVLLIGAPRLFRFGCFHLFDGFFCASLCAGFALGQRLLGTIAFGFRAEEQELESV